MGVAVNCSSALHGFTVVTVVVLLSTSVYFVGAQQVTPDAVPDHRTSNDPADPCKAGESVVVAAICCSGELQFAPLRPVSMLTDDVLLLY